MNDLMLSEKGQRLVNMYSEMAENGYATNLGADVKDAYNSFELRKIRDVVKNKFKQHDVRTVLDYGCGGSDWSAPGFENKISASDFFGLKKFTVTNPPVTSMSVLRLIVLFVLMFLNISLCQMLPQSSETFFPARELVFECSLLRRERSITKW